jgi:hypothetical protein
VKVKSGKTGPFEQEFKDVEIYQLKNRKLDDFFGNDCQSSGVMSDFRCGVN